MPKNNAAVTQAEDLIRSILSAHFNQEIDQDTLRSAAEKVVQTIPAGPLAASSTKTA